MIGTVGVWGHLDSLPIGALRAYVARAEALGYDTLWVPETVGRDPFTLLGLIAGATDRMTLGTSIASMWARDAQATRMAAMTLHEATGGRFVLGLGASHPHMAERLHGQVYDRPLSRMRAYLSAYRAAVYKGPTPAAADRPQTAAGEPPTAATDPPILVAALRERMVALAATEADGAFPYLMTPERVAWVRAQLDLAASPARPLLAVTMPVVLELAPEAARAIARGYLAPYLRTPTYHASWLLQGLLPEDWAQPGSDRLVDAMVAWGATPAVWHRLRAMHDAGADHVAVIPLGPGGITEDLATLEALAQAGLTA